MTRANLGALCTLFVALAVFGPTACNSLLGIEAPPQGPDASDSDADPDADTDEDPGSPDAAVDGHESEEAAADAPHETENPEDAPTDQGGDLADVADAADGAADRNDPDADSGRVDGDAGRTDGDARVDARRPDGSAPPEVHLTLTIDRDQDDCTWINLTDERLAYATEARYVEVGADAEAGKTGLRFVLPVPPGSIIDSAIIQLHRTIGDALPDESMKVQIYDSANVPSFDDAHNHAPEGHVAGGLWPTAVGAIWVGENGKAVQTAELKALVQHVIDRPDWVSGGAVGFVFSADIMGVRWVNFADSSLGIGHPSLKLVYTPPE